ncbi:MAG: toprim domain-containing protein [Candidatus Micrarchaeota archaeon]|nr:toprim domain-containing protein [Candidatus Micrarchaeota archaeon]
MKTDIVKQKLKTLKRVLEHLNTSRVIVLVEGKRDIHALRNSHFYEGEIIQISNRKPHELAQLLLGSDKTVVILTDYDEAGEQLLERFADELTANNIKVDITTRKTLRWILGMNTIEEISTAYADFVAQITCAQHELCLTEEALAPIRNEIVLLNKGNSRVH